jgi:hypothetical protein
LKTNQVRVFNETKKLIWFYIFFLLFEGAFRKWILPGLATPLLIIRDPIALWIIVKIYRNGLFPKSNKYIIMMIYISILSFFMSLIYGHGYFTVAFFGIRIFLLHFPLIFIIGKFFNKDDVEELGLILLWITIPVTILLAIQFYSPQSAWVNRGVGGDMKGSGFGGAMGYFRASTIFSFTNGTSLYYGLVACYILYFWLNRRRFVQQYLLILATICLIIAIPLSISRTLLFSVGLTIIFMLVSFIKRPKNLIKAALISPFFLLIISLLGKLSFFQTSILVFNDRFTSANKTEGGLEGVFIDRFLGGMVGAISNSYNLPFWGYGIGMGTNVGAKIISGKLKFLIAEAEWGRIIGEMGILLGMVIILIRVHLVINLFRKSWDEMQKLNLLPWLLVSFGFVNILQGQWAQPTSLGFSVLIGGLILASREKK